MKKKSESTTKNETSICNNHIEVGCISKEHVEAVAALARAAEANARAIEAITRSLVIPDVELGTGISVTVGSGTEVA